MNKISNRTWISTMTPVGGLNVKLVLGVRFGVPSGVLCCVLSRKQKWETEVLKKKGCTMACADSRRLLIENARVRSPSSPCEICGGQTCSGTGFYLRLLRGVPLSVPFHQCFVFIYLLILLLSEGQADEDWERTKKAKAFSDGLEHWKYYFHIVF